MDFSDLTIEEYVKLLEKRAKWRGETFDWQTASYINMDNDHFEDPNSWEYEAGFPGIVLGDETTSSHDVQENEEVDPYAFEYEENPTEYSRLIALWKELLITKLNELLRFKLGEIYECDVILNAVASMPSNVGNFCGDLTVEFDCDPEVTQTLVDATLNEIRRLQDEGPLIAELQAVLEIDRRESETDLQKNGWWREQILQSYQSRIYSGDVGVSFNADEQNELRFRDNLTPEAAQTALQKIIPFPCSERYTLVTLMPEDLSVEDSE